jgi:hypothetical protein
MRLRLLLAALALAACSAPPPPADVASDVQDADAADVPAPIDVRSGDPPAPDTGARDVQAEAAPPTDASSDVASDGASPCVDMDGDGYGEGCALGPDCNDAVPWAHPGAPELCDGLDDDCDGAAEDTTTAAGAREAEEAGVHCAMNTPPVDMRGMWLTGTTSCSSMGSPARWQCEGEYRPPAGSVRVLCWLGTDPAMYGDCPFRP